MGKTVYTTDKLLSTTNFTYFNLRLKEKLQLHGRSWDMKVSYTMTYVK